MSISYELKKSQSTSQLEQNQSIQSLLCLIYKNQYHYEAYQKLLYQEKKDLLKNGRKPFDFTIILRSPNAFSSPKRCEWFYQQMKEYGLTYKSVKEDLAILEKYNIVKIDVGDTGNRKWWYENPGTKMNATRVYLNPIKDWIIDADTIEKTIAIYNILLNPKEKKDNYNQKETMGNAFLKDKSRDEHGSPRVQPVLRSHKLTVEMAQTG